MAALTRGGVGGPAVQHDRFAHNWPGPSSFFLGGAFRLPSEPLSPQVPVCSLARDDPQHTEWYGHAMRDAQTWRGSVGTYRWPGF